MQTTNFSIPLALCLSLCAPAALAQSISVPDEERRQGMSYEEYSQYREKMRVQMEKLKSEEAKQTQTAPANPANQSEQSNQDSAYGQGYHSRNPAQYRPQNEAGSRPERPRPERINRGDMGRR